MKDRKLGPVGLLVLAYIFVRFALRRRQRRFG
jgi:hypothetical protein